MFKGKSKAITFSHDDGITQDVRLIEIFNKYNLKATFNINSELLGSDGELIRDGVRISHRKNKPGSSPINGTVCVETAENKQAFASRYAICRNI